MKLISQSRWRSFDWGILFAAIFLVLTSLATLYSLELNQDSPDFSLLRRQGLAAGIGIAIFVAFQFIDFRHLKDYSLAFYAIGVITLAALFPFGATIHGTTGWFRFAGVTFQPVELFKIILIIAFAKFFADKRDANHPWIIMHSLAIMAFPAILLYLQPDVGSLLVLVAVWIGFLVVMRLRRVYILSFVFAGLLFSVVAWHFVLAPYQKQRIITFLDPAHDTSGSGYNVRQSKIAIGSGDFLGRGLGLGTQSSLNFLPEQETDFIFAVIAESLGFVGGALVILLYCFLLWRMLKVTHRIKDEFGGLIALGVFFWFSFQGLSNIAMNMGLAPVFGVPLPLLSYGGSSLIASIIALGVVESVCLYSPQEAK